MNDVGRWAVTGVLLASSLIWLSIGRMLPAHPAVVLSFLAVNGLTGFGLGYCFDRVYKVSLKDDLTDAYNRRFLAKKLPSLLARISRRDRSLSITLIDCDNFKKINDEHGHHIGDTVLQIISRFLIENIRHDDYVVRWGGDEFLVIAEHHDHSTSHVIMDRLETELIQLSEEMNIPLSVSVGTAVYPLEASRLEDLIRIADHKMYESKHSKKKAAVS